MIIAAIIIIVIYMASPLIGKLALLVINSFLPDPIPFVDEIIMVIGLVLHIYRLGKLADWIEDHKALAVLILIVIIALLIWLVPIVWRWIT